eukprot:Em0001g1725a
MPSRQEKKRAKRRAKYLQVRDDVLESARASYKADPEKKQTAEREGYHADPETKRSAKRERYHADPEKKRSAERERYHADPEKKRSAKRESYEADPAKKQTEERERYHADPEKKRSAERKRYWEGPECARLAKRVRYGKAKRTLQNQRGHRKRTTDKVIQSYSLYEPKDIVLSEYKSGLEKAILKNSTLLVQSAHAAVSKVCADAVLKKVLNVRRKKAGEFLKDVRAINAIKLEDSHLLEGVRYHTAGSEPFFYDASYNHTRQLGAIPVDLNGRCVVAEEIGDRHLIRMRPLKWKCTNECRLLTSGEMEAVLGTKLLFQKNMEDLRASLDNLDSGCGYVHHDVTLKSSDLRFSEFGGHPICCEFPTCSSPLRVIRAAAPHYPVLRGFLWRLYAAYKKHKDIKAIDGMLSSGSVEELIKYLGLQEEEDLPKLFSEDGEEHAIVSEDHSSPGLGCIESHLRIMHADLMAELQSKFQDDAEFPCCCCERLCRRAAVSCVDFSNVTKYQTASWLALKAHILKNSGTEQLYICKYCQPFLNKNTMPARCVLNGLFTEPVPDELKSLDALNDAAKKVVEVVDKASSKMLEKASVDDIAALQSYTIRSLDQQGSALMDVEQYKMLNVKDDPIQSRQTHLDVMCFPTLFPSGQFGEFHPRDKHVSASEYAKSRLLNKDPRFRKDPQYVFFLLWQQEMRQISAGIYNVLKSTGSVLGIVEHFYFKKEYQMRGAPHYHALLWIQGAPVIGKSNPKDVLAWIQERITCKIPDATLNPELHALVTKYQMHKCTDYCKRRRKLKSGFITTCRFGFPRDCTDIAVLNPVEECLKSRKKIYCLSRSVQECRVNDYNPLILLLWKANMDIQFTAESSLTLAHYVTGYVTKAEKSNMQNVWQEVNANSSIYSKLWSFGIRSLRSRECGLYEASDLLLGDHLTEKSVTVKWIDVAMPHKRKRRLKSHTQLVEMEKNNPGSTDILEGSVVDLYYPTRPEELENVCLYDFVKWYAYSGTSDNVTRVYQKLQKPILPNHKLFDPSIENQREDYYYSLMLLFIPFRDESNLTAENETAELAYNRFIVENADLSKHHEKLQALLKAQTAVRKINEARQEQEAPAPPAEEDAFFQGEAKAAMEDVFHLNEEHDSKTSTYWALPKESLKVMRNGFKHLKLIIIDEKKSVAQLRKAVITCTAVEKFQELLGQGLSPVCLFATRKSCDQFNTDMLSKVGSEVARLPCIDEFDETAGTVKWTKRASSELERLNKDCNMTAGLEAELNLAVGARVMLRRNIDTSQGLVNGALGSVTAISKECIQVTFDHTPKVPFKIERFRSRFQILRRFYVYRKQFPLILAFAVTIHKCQGLSLDCAIVDLSSSVFATGMAYVAISRVRTLAGLHLLAFDPKSIKVSDECVQEVNRLRKLFRPDLTSIPLSKECKAVQHKISALPLVHTTDPVVQHPKRASVKHSAGTKKQKTVDITIVKPIPMTCSQTSASNLNGKKVDSLIEESKAEKKFHSNSNSSVIDLTKGNDVPAVARVAPRITWPEYRYYQTDEQWQREKCRQLNLVFASPHDFVEPGGPNVVLRRPNLRTVVKGVGDGNCLFRCFSYILTGSQNQHLAIRMAIVAHMRSIAPLFEACAQLNVINYASLDHYIASSHMDRPNSEGRYGWGSETEMLYSVISNTCF